MKPSRRCCVLVARLRMDASQVTADQVAPDSPCRSLDEAFRGSLTVGRSIERCVLGTGGEFGPLPRHVALDFGEDRSEFGLVADRGEARVEVTSVAPPEAPASFLRIPERSERLLLLAAQGKDPHVRYSVSPDTQARNRANDLFAPIEQHPCSFDFTRLV